jgi:hypothetical protein
MKSCKYIIPFFFLLFFSSCKPVVTEINDEYVGYWEGFGNGGYHVINIQSNGNATYEGITGVVTVTSSGKARLKDDKFKVGPKKFEFNEGPIQDTSGYWSMTLDEITFYRY